MADTLQAEKTFTQEDVNKIVSERVNGLNEQLKSLTEFKTTYEKEQATKNAENFLTKSNVNVEEFKELKSYDAFLALKDDEREQFVKDLQEKKPHLFKNTKSTSSNKNPLLFGGIKIDTPNNDGKKEIKVY